MPRTSTIADYMTASPHTVGQEQSLFRAHELMHEFGIRHLPVLHGGKLVGTVSLRDLSLTERFDGVDPKKTRVEEAMSADPHVVEGATPLLQVVEYMVERGYGSTIVVENGKVAGVFTSVDAMRALRDVLRSA